MSREPIVDEDTLRDLASSACQEALSFGVNEDVFMRLARTVELRARNAAPQNDESQNVARIEWDGEGLPPVGATCEVTPHNNVWGFSTLETRPCSVIAYHADFAWIDLGLPGVPVATRIDKVDFTPIRTPEQIAADEREKARDYALNTMTGEGWTDGETEEQWQFRLKIVSEMLDMGYRKP